MIYSIFSTMSRWKDAAIVLLLPVPLGSIIGCLQNSYDTARMLIILLKMTKLVSLDRSGSQTLLKRTFQL